MTNIEPTATRTCLIVLGMHRSGTSVVSGALGLLGATLPTDLMEPSSFNPKGYFESQSIMRINEETLRAIGTAWYDLRGISPADLGSITVEKAKVELKEAIRHQYGDASLAVLKDPRFCRTFPALLDAIDDCDALPLVVFSFRNPLEVARSLKTRDGIALDHGLGLWLHHMLEGEFQSRGVRRVFLDYGAFLRDWQTSIGRLERELGIALPRKDAAAEEVDRFIDPDLRHHKCDRHQLEGLSGTPGQLNSTYEAFQKLARNPHCEDAMHDLDLIRADFEAMSSFLGGGLKEYYDEISTLKAVERQMHNELEGLKTQSVDLRVQLQDKKRELQKSERGLQDSQRKLKAIERSRSWRLTKPLRDVRYFMRRISGKISNYRAS